MMTQDSAYKSFIRKVKKSFNSQVEAARFFGVSKQYMNYIYTNRRKPSPKMMEMAGYTRKVFFVYNSPVDFPSIGE
jgi:hypothetical protein